MLASKALKGKILDLQFAKARGFPVKSACGVAGATSSENSLKTTHNSVRSREEGGKIFFLLLLQDKKEICNSCRIMHKQENMIMLIHTFICKNFDSKEHSLKYIFETLEK